MTDFKELLKKDLFFYTDIKSIFKNKKSWGIMIAYIISFAVFGLYGYLLHSAMWPFYDKIISAGSAKYIFEIYLFAFLLISTFINMPYMISTLYYSNEMKILMRLPIKKESIIVEKMLKTLIINIPTALIIFVPFLYKWRELESLSWLTYPVSIIGILLVTIILINIIFAIISLVMRYINRSQKLKNILRFISYSIFFIFIIYFQFIIQKYSRAVASDITGIFKQGAGQLYLVYPHAKLLMNAIFSNDKSIFILYFSLLFFVCVLTTIFLKNVISRIFMLGIMEENTEKDKAGKKISIKESSVVFELFEKELKNIISTPVYLMNKFATGIMFAAFTIIPFFTFDEVEKGKLQGVLNSISESIANNDPFVIGVGLLIVSSIALFIGSTSELTSTTFSREGKQLWMMKTLPIKADDQIHARVLASTLSGLVSTLIFVAFLSYFIRPSILLLLAALIMSIVVNIFLSEINMLVGIYFVNADWDNPAKAIKGFTSLIPVLIAFIFLGILVISSLSMLTNGDMSQNIIYIPVFWTIAFLIVSFILDKFNIRQLKKRLINF